MEATDRLDDGASHHPTKYTTKLITSLPQRELYQADSQINEIQAIYIIYNPVPYKNNEGKPQSWQNDRSKPSR